MSDYVHTGLPSAWHTADRWLATVQVFLELARAAHCLSPLHAVLLAVPPLSAKFLGTSAAARGDFESYRLHHVLWHLIASAACVQVEYAYSQQHAARSPA